MNSLTTILIGLAFTFISLGASATESDPNQESTSEPACEQALTAPRVDWSGLLKFAFGDELEPMDYQVAVAVLQLKRLMPAGFGETQMIKTLRGVSDLTKQLPQWGMVVDSQRYGPKSLKILNRKLEEELVQQNIVYRRNDPIIAGQAQDEYGPDLETLITELQNQTPKITQATASAVPIEVRPKKLTVNDRKKIVRAHLDKDKAVHFFDLFHSLLLRAQVDLLPFGSNFKFPKKLQLSQVATSKNKETQTFYYTIDDVPPLVVDGGFREPGSSGTDWTAHIFTLGVQADFDRESGKFKSAVYVWKISNDQTTGTSKSEVRWNKLLLSSDFHEMFRMLGTLPMIQKTVKQIRKSYDLIQIVNAALQQIDPTERYVPVRDSDFVTFRVKTLEREEGKISVLVSLWRDYRMALLVPPGGDESNPTARFPIYFHITMDGAGRLMVVPQAIVRPDVNLDAPLMIPNY